MWNSHMENQMWHDLNVPCFAVHVHKLLILHEKMFIAMCETWENVEFACDIYFSHVQILVCMCEHSLLM